MVSLFKVSYTQRYTHKKKILFRVDANSKIGWGHFYRCLALADMLKNDFYIAFAVSSPSSKVIEELGEKNYKCIKLPFQEYTTPDNRGESEIKFDLEELIEDVDVILLDGYWFGPIYQNELRKYQVKIAIIEDQGSGEYLADLIINHAPSITMEGYKTDSSNVLFGLGTDYALLRPSFVKAASSFSKNKTTIDIVLISFGGSDYYNLTVKVLKWFLKKTPVNLHVILGEDYKFHDELNRLLDGVENRVKVSKNLAEAQMVSAMLAADAAVLPGSGVLFESIACKLPAISGSYTQNQNCIFKGFLDKKVVFNGDDFSNIAQAWTDLNNSNLTEIRKSQASLIDGNSPKRIKELFQCLI